MTEAPPVLVPPQQPDPPTAPQPNAAQSEGESASAGNSSPVKRSVGFGFGGPVTKKMKFTRGAAFEEEKETAKTSVRLNFSPRKFCTVNWIVPSLFCCRTVFSLPGATDHSD